jgi:hypothetical protein
VYLAEFNCQSSPVGVYMAKFIWRIVSGVAYLVRKTHIIHPEKISSTLLAWFRIYNVAKGG